MSQKIRAFYFESGGIHSHDFNVDELSDTCPICHQGIEPALKQAWIEGDTIAAIFRCPKHKCGKLFVSFFELIPSQAGPAAQIYEYIGSVPKTPEEHNFPDGVKAISEMFSTIYNESAAAEQHGFKNICGAGYRKALEFLIKDYLIKNKKVDDETIKKTLLGTCIKNYIDEGNIKACAERAAWLGNDETHYYRVWEDRDLKDLKNLIDLTVAWINLEHVTRKTIEEMPKGKKEEAKATK